jgi:predicted SAM-dependent methyltransferase
MKKLLLFLLSHRTLALLRWDLHFIKLRSNNVLSFSRTRLKKAIKHKSEDLFLNLGSGPRGIKSTNWLNIDGFKDENVDFICDFSRGLPFDDATFNGIFCEHVLEHFDFENGQKLLKECHRVLKPNGIIRIIIPDGYKILESYFKNPKQLIDYKQSKTGCPIEAVNQFFYQRYEHQCIYDEDYMKYQLVQVGFEFCNRTLFRESKYNEKTLLLDDEKYVWESLYFEGKK